METTIIRIQGRLEREGFDGLFYPGECACERSDLAPCGNAEPDSEGWINGCQPGYKHMDPRPEHAKLGDWCMSRQKEPMTADDFEAATY